MNRRWVDEADYLNEYVYVLETAMDPNVDPVVKVMLADAMIDKIKKNPPADLIEAKMLRALKAIKRKNERR